MNNRCLWTKCVRPIYKEQDSMFCCKHYFAIHQAKQWAAAERAIKKSKASKIEHIAD